ncbi:hypothetical protein [Methylobacterium sp. WCS2018Hpa-22]|uniref:hypothetical protein n=1 Tax=Methylobacterium sp. WCS2018Hpa-22 TaxID=3073633 RepID=UPI00288C5CBC|nr:hypothetical protein [Methylobacterium sp. WCS2018Hpa-22]
MAGFKKLKPGSQADVKPPSAEVIVDFSTRPETFDPAPAEETEKRGVGRPRGAPRKAFATRLREEAIEDIQAVNLGLRLKQQGEAVERAIRFYKAHLIARTREELRLAPEVDDAAVLMKAFKLDD